MRSQSSGLELMVRQHRRNAPKRSTTHWLQLWRQGTLRCCLAKKKLKQVEELETKVAGGLAPSAEQREKLARKAALADELAAVEARL